MSQLRLYRVGAVALVLGAVVVTAANLLAPQGGARDAIASAGYYPAAIAALAGGLLLMSGFPAVYLRQRSESGRLGFTSFALIMCAGMTLTVGFPTLMLLIYPWLAPMSITDHALNNGPVAFNFFFAAASGVVCVGGVLFGIASVRAGVYSRAVGVTFVALSLASFVLGFLSLPGGGGVHMSWWWGTTGTFGVVAYMVGLAWYGLELLQKTRVRRPHRAAGLATRTAAT